MPVRRNADGDVVDERTRRSWDSGRPHQAGDDREPANRQTADVVAPTARPGGGPRGGAPEAGRHGVSDTRRVTGGGPKTRIYRPGQAPAPGGAGPTGPPLPRPGPRGPGRAAPDPMADPPVGWLVVVAGPGKGNVVTLGNGVNAIGRDRTERVSLDFGDDMISRTGHGTITYDPRHRKFYVQHGGGTNLTYVDDEPVLAPRDLEPLAHVQMGDTVLRFVPLCGPGFSWEDEPDDR